MFHVKQAPCCFSQFSPGLKAAQVRRHPTRCKRRRLSGSTNTLAVHRCQNATIRPDDKAPVCAAPRSPTVPPQLPTSGPSCVDGRASRSRHDDLRSSSTRPAARIAPVETGLDDLMFHVKQGSVPYMMHCIGIDPCVKPVLLASQVPHTRACPTRRPLVKESKQRSTHSACNWHEDHEHGLVHQCHCGQQPR